MHMQVCNTPFVVRLSVSGTRLEGGMTYDVSVWMSYMSYRHAQLHHCPLLQNTLACAACPGVSFLFNLVLWYQRQIAFSDYKPRDMQLTTLLLPYMLTCTGLQGNANMRSIVAHPCLNTQQPSRFKNHSLQAVFCPCRPCQLQ